VPLFSIPSRTSWGIGEIPDINRLACWMREAGFDFLKLLPLNEMADGQHSPYSALSAMAIDPIYIALAAVPDIEALGGEALLSHDERDALDRARRAPAIEYSLVRPIKVRALSAGFDRFMRDEWAAQSHRAARLTEYIQRERWWLDDYTLFRAIHAREDGRYWREWEPGVRDRHPEALEHARQSLPPMERLILKMKFEDRAAISDIARALHLEQRPLYRTVERLLKTVGESMQAEGISAADIDALLAAPPIELNKDPDTGPLPPANVAGREERKGASWARSR